MYASKRNRRLGMLYVLPALLFVGRISYAVYLWHVPLLRLTGTTYGRTASLLPLAIAVGVAVLSTLVVEEPLRRAWRRHVGTVATTPGALPRPSEQATGPAGCSPS